MTNAAQQPQAQYHYVQGGNKQFADRPPPPGVAYDKVVNGKVVERYVLSNGVLARVLTKEQQAAADARSAIEARNAASDAAAKSLNAQVTEQRARLVEVGERLTTAGERLNASRHALFEEIQTVNRRLGYQDTTQDAIGYAAAGVAAAVVVVVAAAPTLLAVGTAAAISATATVVGAANTKARPPPPEPNPALSRAGEARSAASLANNAAKVAKTTGLLGPAGAVVSRSNAAFGLVYAGYQAETTAARAIQPSIYSRDQLASFQTQVDAFKPSVAERAFGVDDNRLKGLKRLAEDTDRAQTAYDEVAAEYAQEEAKYNDLLRQVGATWVAPK
jgi:hypothetical protein